MHDEEIRRLIRAETRRHRGVVAGLLGCAFAVLGIFTIGILFVPVAILCSVIGFARAAGALSGSGLAVSLLGCFLSAAGVISSPTLLLATADLFATAQHTAVTPSSESVASSPEMRSPQSVDLSPESASTLSFSMDAHSDGLPVSGPQAWCRKADTIANITKALSRIDSVRDANVVVTDFEGATTVAIDPKSASFSCHGLARVTGGQLFPGTFSVLSDLSGKQVWQWANDGGTTSISPLITCGSGGCFPTDNSVAARAAADRANEENRKASLASTNQSGNKKSGPATK